MKKPQTVEIKDLQSTLPNSDYDLRNGDRIVRAQLLHHQYQFPSVQSRESFGVPGFRPSVASGLEIDNFRPTFASPLQCLRFKSNFNSEQNIPSVNQPPSTFVLGKQSFSANSQYVDGDCDGESSLLVHSSKLTVKNSDDQMSGSSQDSCTSVSETPNNVEDIQKNDYLSCPVCGVAVTPKDLESHLILEVNGLKTVPQSNQKERTENNISSAEGSEDRWNTYQKIEANRNGRLKLKSRKRKSDVATCPICNKKVHGSDEEINSHVEFCLKKNESETEDENIDVEGDVYEEYEWAGQKRIRAASLLQGGFAAAGVGTTVSKSEPSDEDIELVVDDDDSITYGPPQYSERDIHNEEESSANQNYETEDCLDNCSPESKNKSGVDNDEGSKPLPSTNLQVVEALKTRIRELEIEKQAIDNVKFKCLICMEPYTKPVISICCWHVYCEECWLKSLGAKKLCPQCNMITSLADLRKVYL